mmetsp:Transcript_32394/g.91783  ORF Transcript_32394/g.91783 Transcript_32394/m.91783 type:complete len:417 (+) Transcript_32394:239-1489(+)
MGTCQDRGSAGSTPTSSSKLKAERNDPFALRPTAKVQKRTRSKGGHMPKGLKQFYNRYVGDKVDATSTMDKLVLLHEVALDALEEPHHPQAMHLVRAASTNIPMIHHSSVRNITACKGSAPQDAKHPPITLERSHSDTDPFSRHRGRGKKGRIELVGPCGNCDIAVSPQWRKGPPEAKVLCNACGTRWLRNKKLEGKKVGRGVGNGKAVDGASRAASDPHPREEDAETDLGLYSATRRYETGPGREDSSAKETRSPVPNKSMIKALQKAMERTHSLPAALVGDEEMADLPEEPGQKKQEQPKRRPQPEKRKKSPSQQPSAEAAAQQQLPSLEVQASAMQCDPFLLNFFQAPAHIQALLISGQAGMSFGAAGPVMSSLSNGQSNNQAFIEAAQYNLDGLRWLMASTQGQQPGFTWNN